MIKLIIESTQDKVHIRNSIIRTGYISNTTFAGRNIFTKRSSCYLPILRLMYYVSFALDYKLANHLLQ